MISAPPPKPAQLFISYAHADRSLLKRLLTHLSALKREGLISAWADREILPGADWMRQIDERLEAAAIVLLLVSPDFVGSEYCMGVELERARALEAEGRLRIVPVIIKPCDWRSPALGFSRYQGLPADGRAVSVWRPRDAGLQNVVEELRRLFAPVAVAAQPSNEPAPAAVSSQRVDAGSKYARYRISMIVKSILRDHGLNIDNLNLDRGINVRDLEALCSRLYFAVRPRQEIKDAIAEARAVAFTAKYAVPGEDEKLLDVGRLRIDGAEAGTIRPWRAYFFEVLASCGVERMAGMRILDVGAGHGLTCKEIYEGVDDLIAVDVSDKALAAFRENFQGRFRTHVATAERLDGVESGAIDLYLSFRTYQSTLFDRRSAIIEAFRVLSYGGKLIVSVPRIIPRGENSPFELFVTATRGGGD